MASFARAACLASLGFALAAAPARADAPPIPEAGPCGGFATLKGEATHGLLDRRLRITGLPGAEDIARAHDIMAAPAARRQESRLLIDHAGRRFVVFSVETFRTVAPEVDLTTRVQAELGPSYAVEPLALAPPLRGAWVVLESLDLDGDGTQIAGAFTVTADGLAQATWFYVTPSAIRTGGCLAFARRLAGTLAPGERQVDAAGGPAVLDGRVAVTVAPGHYTVEQPGPDFTVLRIQPLVAMGRAGGLLGIYLGGHPSFRPPTDARTSDVKHGALTVTWHAWTADGVHHRQALLPAGDLRVHVFASSPDADVFAGLEGMTHSVRVLDGPRAP